MPMIQVLWILIKNTSQYKDSKSNIMHDDSVSKLKEWIWVLDHATEKGEHNVEERIFSLPPLL